MVAVSIAGMHRSGTSMVARLLNVCGLYLGEETDLLQPAPDNPEGFWENRNFVLLNDEILSNLDGAWDVPPVIKTNWEQNAEMIPLKVKAAQVLRQFTEYEFWGWKDPRNSLTLPFWRQIVPSLKVVVCVRNPLEVARSISKRNLSSAALGYNLWLQYNQQLFSSINSEDYIVTHYDSYFNDPQAELKRVLNFLNINNTDEQIIKAVSSISSLLRRNHDVHLSVDEVIPIEVVKIYERLCAQAGPVYQLSAQNDFVFNLASIADNENYEKELLKAKLVEKEQHEKTLKISVDELKEQITENDKLIAEKERVIAEKQQTIAKQERDIQDLTTQAKEIMNSNLWRILRRFVRIREVLIPYGSKRESLYYLISSALHVLRAEGWRAFLKATHRKLFGIKNPVIHLSNEMGSIRPVVSIVIPVFNSAKLTKDCIEQIYNTHNQASFEVIVVDNHSTDATNQFLKAEKKRRQNLNSYRMSENLGFAGAVNYGCRQASGSYMIILNNDTLVTPSWLDKLIEPFQHDELIGIVSPVTNFVGEGPQIDSHAVDIKPNEIQAYAEKIKGRSYIGESNRLVFFCVAIKKEVFDIIGDLDVGYEKGNYEDDDYCMRAITAGFKLAIARGAFVYHFGSMTFKNNNISHNESMEKNRKRFYEKAQNISSTLRLPGQNNSEVIISVVVRTFNRPRLLQKALTSLSNQTFKDFEVIVVNDGGQDVSDLLKIFEKYYPITYIHNAVSNGRTPALNNGIKHSKGEWLTFLDDDDLVYPWHLDTLISSARQNTSASFLYSDYNRCLFTSQQDNHPQLTEGVEPWQYDAKKMLVNNHIPIHTWLISRKCFEKIGFFNENQSMLEDYEFLVRLSKVFNFYHVQRFTCEYRYYLDGVNSMVIYRPDTLRALKYIYDQHPVDDPYIIQERKAQLLSLENQIKEVKNLYSLLEEKPGDEAYIYRKIIRLVTGL